MLTLDVFSNYALCFLQSVLTETDQWDFMSVFMSVIVIQKMQWNIAYSDSV